MEKQTFYGLLVLLGLILLGVGIGVIIKPLIDIPQLFGFSGLILIFIGTISLVLTEQFSKNINTFEDAKNFHKTIDAFNEDNGKDEDE